MNNKAARALVPMFIQRSLGLLLFLFGLSGQLSIMAKFYFVVYFLYLTLCVILVQTKNPHIFIKRSQIPDDLPYWEKITLFLYWLLHFFVFYYFAGRSYEDPTLGYFILGHLFIILSTFISCASLLVNPFYDSSAHMQENHYVVTGGVYRFVRHPGYLAILIGALGQSLVFSGLFPRLLLLFISLLIVLRTHLEDRMLIEELSGYSNYAKKTRYRIFPYIW